MKFYCRIDLSARDCRVCVIDEHLKVMVQQSCATSCRESAGYGAIVSSAASDVGT